VLPGEALELLRIAADQQRVRHQSRSVLESDAALFSYFQYGSDEVLVHSHPAGDAVHDDADALLIHYVCLIACQSGIAPLA